MQKILNLSRSTTIGVINSAEKWLRDYELELIRRPNYGYLIAGDERNWRESIVSLLHESFGDARLLALFQGNTSVVDVPYRTRTGLEEELIKIFTRLDISAIKNLVSPIKYNLEGSLSDHAYIDFYFYLAIAVHRSRLGKNMDRGPDLTNYPNPKQRLSKAMKISASVHRQFGIHFPEAEIEWIALKMPESIPLLSIIDRSETVMESESDPFVRESVDLILAQASLSLHPSLRADENLKRTLFIALESIFHPGQRGQALKPSFLQELKDRYPYIYSVARQSSLLLKDNLRSKLTDPDIGEITICLIAAMERLRLFEKVIKKVLVVCSAGVATAWLLVSLLRSEFPGIEVVEVISVLELENRKNFDGIDCIVATVPIKVKNIPSRQVNPLLGVEDCKRLKELFEGIKNFPAVDRHSDFTNKHLSDLLTPETIELGVMANCWQEVVEKAGARLVEIGAIETQFIEAMKNIILDYGPYMVIWPGAVLLHAPPHGVRQLCMKLVSLKDPVPFGHAENDPVRIAIILGAIDSQSHITALLELNQMMQDIKARSAIGTTLHKSVVLHWIAHYSK